MTTEINVTLKAEDIDEGMQGMPAPLSVSQRREVRHERTGV